MAQRDQDEELYSEKHVDTVPDHPPTGSLTVAAFNPYSNIPLARRLSLISGSVFINLGLPFLNGVMLGFGEIFARVVLAPALGITRVGWMGDTAKAIVNWPWLGKHHPQAAPSRSSPTGNSDINGQNLGEFDDWSAPQFAPSDTFDRKTHHAEL
ncbi:hypothetical protein BCV70DRAFT_167744 [Testicularia cyperi]|uniref:TOM13-domain-containing protein n=1 Tax=Testicularia cyperi TaxID=1882483 RepID=A0A317XIH1_9BASI|nr:hypothetical protein BCV70DRAFT_167744 [Testicularia cyperi]